MYLSQTDDIPETKISKAPENDSFAVSLIPLELREHKDYMKVGESKVQDC